MQAATPSVILTSRRPQANSPVQRIRLHDRAGAPELFLSSTTDSLDDNATSLSSSGFAGSSTKPRGRLGQLLPGAPMWDVARLPGGGEGVVMSSFGGALHALEFCRLTVAETDLTPEALTDPESTQDFLEPRFIRAFGPSPGITAVPDGKRIVLFPLPLQSAPEPARDIAPAGDGAMIVKAHASPVLLYKQRQWGKVRGVVTFPGTLMQQRLSNEYTPAAEPEKLLGDRVIFEFDAAPSEQGLVICASTEKGFLLAETTALNVMPLIDTPYPQELLQPAVALHQGTVYLAFLRAPGAVESDLLTGSFSTPARIH